MPVFASVSASARFIGTKTFMSAVAEQLRNDADPPPSFDLALDFDDELWQAIHSQTRLTGAEFAFDGNRVLSSIRGPAQFSQAMTVGQFSQLNVQTIGAIWGIPHEDEPIQFNDPTLPPPPPPSQGKEPPAWGNRPVKFTVLMGRNASMMRGRRLFQGYSLQKKTSGDFAIQGQITCVDDSILYANKPVCYELGPFSGKRRGQIVREIAENLGIPKDKIFVPMGEVVNKPVLLSNASLLPFVAEFGLPENWFPFFDEYGNFRVIDVEMKQFPDCDVVIDATKGDYSLDGFEEVPPAQPSATFYTTASFPVANNDPDNPNIVTTVQTEELIALYNPLCRANAFGAHLQSDGQYRAFAGQILMLVSRTRSEISTKDGIEFKRVAIIEEMYNPLQYDPNFDTAPPTNDYTAAYGDKTFHIHEVEILMETQRQTTDSEVDRFGTLQKQVVTSMGWVAPECAIPYATPGGGEMKSLPGQFVWPGPSARIQQAELYRVVKQVTKLYSYNGDGTLGKVGESEWDYYSPESRCDIYVTIVDDVPIPTPIPTPIIPQPPPSNPYTPPVGPPPVAPRPPVTPPPAWIPTITGPTKVVTDPLTGAVDCFFDVAFPNATAAATYVVNLYLTVRDSRGGLIYQKPPAAVTSSQKTATIHAQLPRQSALEQSGPIATIDAMAQVFGPDISPFTGKLLFWPYSSLQPPPSLGSGGAGAVRLSFTASGAEIDVAADTFQEFTLNYANVSHRDATNVNIIHKIPQTPRTPAPWNTAPYSFDSATGGGTYDSATQTVRWNIGQLLQGDSGSVKVRLLENPGLPPNTSILSKFTLDSSETTPLDVEVQFTERRGWQG